jgi:Asp-tRNA(Asn)/Glu-tRNA(Gln) amidotransferase A subunit family amidase
MRGFAEYVDYDGLGLAQLIHARQVSAAEVLEAAIARIEQLNPHLNAVVTKVYDQARGEAAALDRDAPFAGVPFLLKDLGGALAGVPLTGGSRFFANAPAPADAEIVTRHKRAGLMILGRTNTPEFGLSATTEPVLFGPTRNPWDLTRSAGGSSGGSAAAVAARMVPLAHASDGGGSIRIPASCCGLFGMKTTRSRNTMAPYAGESLAGSWTRSARRPGVCASRSPLRPSAARRWTRTASRPPKPARSCARSLAMWSRRPPRPSTLKGWTSTTTASSRSALRPTSNCAPGRSAKSWTRPASSE